MTGARDYRRILLIRTDRVGDLVLSTPAIASFRRSWPKSRIEILVNDYTEPVMRHNPDVDAVLAIPRLATPAQARAAAREAGADADLAVALAPRTADYRLAAWTRAPERLGYVYRRRYLSRLAATYLLTDHCISDADPAQADRHPDRPIAHEVHQVQALVRLAGGTVITDDLVLHVSEDDREFARAHVPAGATAVNLAPRWFLPNFGFDATAMLVNRLAASRRDILVTYGNDVPDAAARLRDAVSAPNVTWLGGLPLLRWAASVGECSIVVTVDTGATHIASAMGVPAVVIFERTYYALSSQEWSPWRVPNALLCKPPAAAAPDALIDDVVAAVQRLAKRDADGEP
ncbi:MAG TPA: glycosyltransferase family 9 protein [Candidatus Eremiobacteraceae bacterium]|nr:glycosyltransferase family 9 protein [Candidatus Eremiobacteraceae bacterium]